jgi:hypothetical protein
MTNSLSLFHPIIRKWFCENINNESAKKSKYAESLKKFGFKATHKGLEIWRSKAGTYS